MEDRAMAATIDQLSVAACRLTVTCLRLREAPSLSFLKHSFFEAILPLLHIFINFFNTLSKTAVHCVFSSQFTIDNVCAAYKMRFTRQFSSVFRNLRFCQAG